ncbi:MAG: NAD-dependent deacylase [Saprospiraceae bacterium]
MEKVIVLSGAGMSAESGIKTFRDQNGLWHNHDVMEVASPQGWRKDKSLVLEFYNQRRAQLKEVNPNKGHLALAALENNYDVQIITQNVDDLHERAGSKKVLHLHGELRKARSTKNPALVYEWQEDILLGDTCELGSQLRPHIVWFGEAVPMIERAAQLLLDANIVIIVGTSMQVYPAAGLIAYAPNQADIFYVDPKPAINYELRQLANLKIIEAPATVGLAQLTSQLS